MFRCVYGIHPILLCRCLRIYYQRQVGMNFSSEHWKFIQIMPLITVWTTGWICKNWTGTTWTSHLIISVGDMLLNLVRQSLQLLFFCLFYRALLLSVITSSRPSSSLMVAPQPVPHRVFFPTALFWTTAAFCLYYPVALVLRSMTRKMVYPRSERGVVEVKCPHAVGILWESPQDRTRPPIWRRRIYTGRIYALGPSCGNKARW